MSLPESQRPSKHALSRRSLLKAGAAASVGTLLGPAAWGRVAGSDVLRIGLVGSGGRGVGAAIDCLEAAPGVRVVAIGDLFKDRVESAQQQLISYAEKRVAEERAAATQPAAASQPAAAPAASQPASQPATPPPLELRQARWQAAGMPSQALAGDVSELVDLPPDRCFHGWDCCERVLDAGVDVVLLAAPPGFRPWHFEAAIRAGKHVFMEKPVAVDPVGARRVIQAAQWADAKGLCVVAGTQRRHQPSYLETMQRVLNGAIGDVVAAQCYWNQGALWVKRPQGEWSEMEWQCRNWLYFDWLSGDHIVEQHVHNLDVINWALGTPLRCVGMGGRAARIGPEYGNVWDHFAVEYEYAGGVRVMSMCRQTAGASDRVAERLVGTKGVCNPDGRIEGEHPFAFEEPEPAVNPYVREHEDLIRAIRRGEKLNEAQRVAESTLTAIMGRMSAYSGREVSWDWVINSSKLDLTPPRYAFGPVPLAPTPVPGHTRLV